MLVNQYVHVVPVGPARGKRVRRRWDLPGGDGGLSTTSQGKQIMPEAARKVVRFFFEEVGANRIYAGHDVNNPKSGRAMQKLGLRCSYVQVRPERIPVMMIPLGRPMSGLIQGFCYCFSKILMI